jgi:homoserine kinase
MTVQRLHDPMKPVLLTTNDSASIAGLPFVELLVGPRKLGEVAPASSRVNNCLPLGRGIGSSISSGQAALAKQDKEKGRDQDSQPNQQEHCENDVTAHPTA